MPIARKEGENGGDAEHECRTDERNWQTGHKGEEPNANEGEKGGEDVPFSAGAASGNDDHERVEGVKDGKMQTGERQEVAGAALAEEFARRAVYSGTIAECHGRK